MNRKTIVAGILAIGLSLCGFSQAQDQASLKVATGSASGTYSRMLKEISNTCGTGVTLVEVPTSGSVENVSKLVGNELNAGFVQTDVLFFRARNESLDNIKTLVALHPEEVHIVALSQSKTIVGKNMVGLGGEPLKLDDVSGLEGHAVASWGGSFVTSQVIRLQSEIRFSVVEVADAKAAKALLDEGKVEAVIAVGGSPLGFVNDLGPGYKLLSISDATATKLKAVYRPAKVTYAKLGRGGSGIQTVATDALFVTREYKTAKFTSALGKLRDCIYANLDEMKETTGTHPKWQVVDASNKGKWQWYDLPSANVAKVTLPIKKK